MTGSYITVSGTSCSEITINKSRFISYAFPCTEESDAVSFLQRIKEEHKTAKHHCYAYIIGENSGIMRYSDDGEPGGTAGLPIMNAIRSKGIVNCCVIVVRYFGGVLLGTGGLVRAYTQSAQGALEAAGIAVMEWTSRNLCEIPYDVWDRFRYVAGQLPVKIENIEYGASVCFHLCIRMRDKDTVLPKLIDAAGRSLSIDPLKDIFSAWNNE